VKKIAITGASGFIGKHILSELCNHSDIQVIAIVRPGSKKHTISPQIKWVEIDIVKPPENLFEVIGKPDIVIHLAWNHLNNYMSLEHFETELPAQYFFLKELLTQGLKNLFVSGTCFEYGLQSGELSANITTQPVTPYGLAKDTLRKQLEFLKNTINFNFTWGRLFYIYGEDQPASTIFQQLKRSTEKGETVFKMSGGEQLRDYLPIKVVAEQIIKSVLMKKNSGPINICSGQAISIRTLVEHWIKDNNWDIELELGHYPYPKYEPMAFWGKASL